MGSHRLMGCHPHQRHRRCASFSTELKIHTQHQSEPSKMDSLPLLEPSPTLTRAVNHLGDPICRSTTGGWTSALFIIGVEIAERSAYYGISLNLITYLTTHLGQSTAAAAAGVNTWSGVSQMMPLFGAYVADSYLGRYRMTVIASLLYILGLVLLTTSSILPRTFSSQFCTTLFYFSLYLIAFAQGGHKPCVQAFGADQFDENDPKECITRSSFFNWWYFGMNSGMIVSLIVLPYIQDNISWGIGFGIPCVLMMIALIVFLIGTKTYRYFSLGYQSPFAIIGRSIILLFRNGGDCSKSSSQSNCRFEEGTQTKSCEDLNVLSNKQAEANGVLGLFPIWFTCLIYGIVVAQSTTFFTKQGSTMDRRIGPTFEIPAASLQSIISIAIITFIVIYDRIIVPLSRNITKNPSGLTPLQRIGTGLFISVLSMIISASVEIKRLNTAKESGLVDKPEAMVPMSLWWLIPQYVLFGIADAFAVVGLQELFYDQVPDSLRSLGLALYLSIPGIGGFLSSFLVYVIDKVTKTEGDSWFSNNLNRAHLDYFYWLLAALSALGTATFVFFANNYVYKRKSINAL